MAQDGDHLNNIKVILLFYWKFIIFIRSYLVPNMLIPRQRLEHKHPPSYGVVQSGTGLELIQNGAEI